MTLSVCLEHAFEGSHLYLYFSCNAHLFGGSYLHLHLHFGCNTNFGRDVHLGDHICICILVAMHILEMCIWQFTKRTSYFEAKICIGPQMRKPNTF